AFDEVAPMSTSSRGDRPRRPFPQQPQREEQQPAERQQPHGGHRRDDLRHVDEELAQAQSQHEDDELEADVVEPDPDALAMNEDAVDLEQDTLEIEAVPPVASRALPPQAQPRAGKRFDPPSPSVVREIAEKAARR